MSKKQSLTKLAISVMTSLLCFLLTVILAITEKNTVVIVLCFIAGICFFVSLIIFIVLMCKRKNSKN